MWYRTVWHRASSYFFHKTQKHKIKIAQSRKWLAARPGTPIAGSLSSEKGRLSRLSPRAVGYPASMPRHVLSTTQHSHGQQAALQPHAVEAEAQPRIHHDHDRQARGGHQSLLHKLQCPSSPVPMPCPNRSTAVPIHHVHFPKMAGRSVAVLAPKLLGQPMCNWAPFRASLPKSAGGSERPREADFGNSSRFLQLVQSHRADLRRRPCFTTYEMGPEPGTWEKLVAEGFGRDAPPLMLMMLREPRKWTSSAIQHGFDRGQNGGPNELYELGCLRPHDEQNRVKCRSYDYTRPAAALLPGGAKAGGFVEGRAKLDASLFGLVEHFAASTCLWKFQTGGTLEPLECDCRRQRQGRPDGDEEAEASPSERSGGGAPQIGRAHAQMPPPTAATERALAMIDYGDYSKLYAYARHLFAERVRVVERATGVRLLCEPRGSSGVATTRAPAGRKQPTTPLLSWSAPSMAWPWFGPAGWQGGWVT